VLQSARLPGLLQTTALLHEVWLRLRNTGWESLGGPEGRFAALAAKTIRAVVVDEARREGRLKRGGGRKRVPLSEVDRGSDSREQVVDALALDAAIEELARLSPRRALVVEMRFFGGMTVERIAEVLGVSKRTVESEWEHARAWLRHRLISGR
jgi:RNA polymerase sigma-70 factor, ECF subfamily